MKLLSPHSMARCWVVVRGATLAAVAFLTTVAAVTDANLQEQCCLCDHDCGRISDTIIHQQQHHVMTPPALIEAEEDHLHRATTTSAPPGAMGVSRLPSSSPPASSNTCTCLKLHEQAASLSARTPECQSLKAQEQAAHCCLPSATTVARSSTIKASQQQQQQHKQQHRQELFICTVCHSGKIPANMKMGVAVLQYPSARDCRDLYDMGLAGEISEQMCNPLQDAMDVPCGCCERNPAGTPCPIESPTPWTATTPSNPNPSPIVPITLPTAPAPTPSPNDNFTPKTSVACEDVACSAILGWPGYEMTSGDVTTCSGGANYCIPQGLDFLFRLLLGFECAACTSSTGA